MWAGLTYDVSVVLASHWPRHSRAATEGAVSNMVDCCKPRCLQEKRILKKELLSWYKKVPYLVGLEELTGIIFGSSVKKHLTKNYKDFAELGEAEDFEPLKICFYCENKSRLPLLPLTPPLEGDGVEDDKSSEGLQQYSGALLLEKLVNAAYINPKNEHSLDHPNNQDEENSPTVSPTKKNSRKNYSADELNQAVLDIKSGRLGTRRAAVLYGIPRSTLRNKIFRAQEATNHHTNKNEGKETHEPPAVVEQPLEMLHHINKMRIRHRLHPGRLFGEPPTVRQQLAHPVLPTLIRKLTREALCGLKNDSCNLSNYLFQQNAKHSCQQPALSKIQSSLKIPDFKGTPKNSALPRTTSSANQLTKNEQPEPLYKSNTTTGTIGETLKEIISKSIAEKIRNRMESNHKNSKSQFTNILPKAHVEQISSVSMPDNRPVKKTRPKRGQYRKYNSQLLHDAVRAVQRGEMSVHRAGSYYGVPHSTLEYKVKERHLLRQRKKENEKNRVDTLKRTVRPKPAVTDGAAFSILPGLPIAWSSPGSDSSQLVSSAGSVVPFSNFALNTSASDLLKKLQIQAQAQTSEISLANNAEVPTPVVSESVAT